MKKLLSVFMLLGSVVALGRTSSTAVMNVEARVIDSLTIRVDEHVNFGDVIKGQSYDEKGKVSIKAQVGEGVAITYDGVDSNGDLPMVGSDGTTIMKARVSHPTTWHVAQSDGFESIQPITVWLDVPEGIKSQLYKADITIKARYQ